MSTRRCRGGRMTSVHNFTLYTQPTAHANHQVTQLAVVKYAARKHTNTCLLGMQASLLPLTRLGCARLVRHQDSNSGPPKPYLNAFIVLRMLVSSSIRASRWRWVTRSSYLQPCTAGRSQRMEHRAKEHRRRCCPVPKSCCCPSALAAII